MNTSSPKLSVIGNKSDQKSAPANIDAEQVIIGSILINNDNINKIGDFLLADDFYHPIHREIYEAILRLVERGLIAEPITLKNEFDSHEGLKDLGGTGYLLQLSNTASGIIDVKTYASIVHSLAVSRRLIDIGEDMVNDAYNSTGELRASEQIEISEQKLFNLASQGNSDTNFVPLSGAVIEALESAEAASKRKGVINGVVTQFRDLDKLLGGFHNSDLVILAARPSMGKTALALNFAMKVADSYKKEYENKKNKNLLEAGEKQKSVGIFSLEMSSEQLATRLLSVRTGISATDIRRGKLNNYGNNNEYDKLVEESKNLNSLPIHIDETPALSISAIRTRARRLSRKHNLSFLVIDYLQLIRGVGSQGRENRVQEISEISMGLKAIAKELNIPVLALSQLSRAVESRSDKKPQLSDLRESGSIEQDADMVIFIYREDYYLEREKPSEENGEELAKWQERMERCANLSDIIVSKNRNGPIGNVPLYFDKNTTEFKDLDSYHGNE